MDNVLPFLGSRPRVAASTYLAPSATLIGDVEIGAAASIWFGAVLRGDVQSIRVGAGSNIQDLCVLHGSTGGASCLVGARCTVGHGAVLHSCTLEDEAFVGFGARVLDGARVCSGGVLAAGAVLTPGKTVGPGELWVGNPARLLRPLGADELARYRGVAQRYVELAAQYRHTGQLSTGG